MAWFPSSEEETHTLSGSAATSPLPRPTSQGPSETTDAETLSRERPQTPGE